ncbi:MAG: glycosyltransferase family 4 protein [Anaerolineales bacterium]|nr:glycosyltransferase family 4 protein [Anaerolineales bacterium]
MKILFLSNMYPPHVIGGYEALCQEAVEGLAKRGHRVSVLTSTYGYDGEVSEGDVHRLLSLEGDLQFYKMKDAWTYPARKRRNLEHLRRMISTEKPDIVFIWGMWNLSKSLALEAERLMGGRVVYYLANPWPVEANMHRQFWDAPATSFAKNIAKRLVRIPARVVLREEWENVPLQFQHAPCCSAAQRDQLLEAGVPLKDAPVIYEGVDLGNYLAQADKRTYENNGSLSLVFIGILAEHKGVHTTIEALTQLSAEERRRVHLTILGKGHSQYEERLRNLVSQYQLSDLVTFHAPIPRSELPEFMGGFDVLLLPSIWAEPLARIMQEGLACGMVVVGSANGGTAETIVHGENGLLFRAGDAADLARQVKRLLDDPSLRRSLAEGGRRTAEEKFDVNRLIENLETYLKKVDENARAN